MVSIFSWIIVGEIFCYKIVENEDYFVFLDINFCVEGYMLVIFKQEVDYIFDLEDVIYVGLWVFFCKVVIVLEKVVFCKRIGIIVIGLEVFYVYVYFIFINWVVDINFECFFIQLSQEIFVVIVK